jgi:hypothetical protein
MTCRHCGRSRVNRPRGLCWSCYYTPGVRERYPSTSKFAKRGVGNGNGLAPLPLMPTRARPGSPEKVAVLEERARRRQALWHPLDAPMDTESLPQDTHVSFESHRSYESYRSRKCHEAPRSLLLGVA